MWNEMCDNLHISRSMSERLRYENTTLNGNTYKVLNGFHYISRTFWLREEVQNKKVFLSTEDGNTRNEDLIYDAYTERIIDDQEIYDEETRLSKYGEIVEDLYA